LQNMKKKLIIASIIATPTLLGLLLAGGFKLQQVIAPFGGVSTEQDGAYVEHRYYLALRPSHIRTKVGGGRLSRVRHGEAVAYWPDGALRGKWRYVDGSRHGHVTTWHSDGRLRATWTAHTGGAVEGSLKVYTEEAREDFAKQGAENRHGALTVSEQPDNIEE